VSAARLPALLTAAFGVLTLAAFASFSFVQNAYGPGDLAPAVSAFQRSAAGAPLTDLFNSWAEIQAMNAVNTADLYAFIPAYTLFLAAAALYLAGGVRPLALAAILAVIVGAGADMLETLAQLRVTGAVSEADWARASTSESIAPLHWLKYGALGVNALAVALICLVGPPRRWIVGVIALAPLPVVAAAYAGSLPPRAFSIAFALYWIALLALSVTALVRKPT
jgi:hypothetical protein